MRLFSILAQTTFMATLLSAPAFAADLGTYRPGSPYHSVVAPGADVCQSHCAGDAQCRGWNYVKVNPRAPGVCEFNSKIANPIESAISISGNGARSAAPNLIRGGTNTVRVGTSMAPKARPQTRQASPTRRVVREAVPQRVRPQQTVARTPSVRGLSLTEQQNNYRRSTGHAKHAPQTGQQMPQAQQQITREQYMRQQAARQQHAQRPQVQNPRGPRLMRDPRIAPQPQAPQVRPPQFQRPQFQHSLDGAERRMTATQGYPMQRGTAPAPQNTARPPIGVPITSQTRPQAQGSLPRSSAANPVTHQNAGQKQTEARQRAAYLAQAPMSAQQAQQSLFGSLNDDVRGPKPLLQAPSDPDAPIATAQSRPTKPVTQEQLGALAGAPAR